MKERQKKIRLKLALEDYAPELSLVAFKVEDEAVAMVIGRDDELFTVGFAVDDEGMWDNNTFLAFMVGRILGRIEHDG